MAAATTSTSTPVPSDAILKFLQDILEAWDDEKYSKVQDLCAALLRRKKTMYDLGLTPSLQRLQIQALLYSEEWSKVLEHADMMKGPTDLDVPIHLRDLVLYARYRRKEYATVSQQASAVLAASTATTTAMTPNDGSALLVAQHLMVQSQFHSDQTLLVLKGYRDLMDRMDDDGSTSSVVDDDAEAQEEAQLVQMQILTNALAAIASSSCVPYVSLPDDGNNTDELTESFSSWMDRAERLLETKTMTTTNEFSDLAMNLGSLRFLTDDSSPSVDWLQNAEEMLRTTNGSTADLAVATNLQWRRHFWYRDVDEVSYPTITGSSGNKLSVPQSIIKLNQSLLDESVRQMPAQPHPKWNTLQVRLYWYNRAVLQFKAQHYVECQESCQSLKKSLSHAAAGGGSSTGSFGAGANKKKKNKANSTAVFGSNGSDHAKQSSASSPPFDLWWESRSDVILAYAQQAQSKTQDALTRLDERLQKLQSFKRSALSDPILDHATTHLKLHRFLIEHGAASSLSSDRSGNTTAKRNKKLLALLKSLPPSIRNRPAVQLTMDDLETTVVASGGDGISSNQQKSKNGPFEDADAAFAQGRYQAACDLYQQTLPEDLSRCDDDTMDRQLKYVQALALCGQHEASQQLSKSLSSVLDGVGENGMPNGAALESKGLPRNLTGSVGKHLVTTNDDAETSSGPSRDKIMRRRARKREQYLKELEAKGLYNPDRPAKPNPERWIPKHERSRSRGGGGRNRNNNSGNHRSAQGGGSQVDAQRLDAAARRAGNVPASTGPSTANIKVGSSGRKGGRRR